MMMDYIWKDCNQQCSPAKKKKKKERLNTSKYQNQEK